MKTPELKNYRYDPETVLATMEIGGCSVTLCGDDNSPVPEFWDLLLQESAECESVPDVAGNMKGEE